jgi:SAM-dependent methyltransferase
VPADADEQRAAAARAWEQAAPGWAKRREQQQRDAAPVSLWLVEQARLQPGHRVLEVAAGVGETGLLAAELVRPGGNVLLTDVAETMLDAARDRAAELGLDEVEVEVAVADAEWLDVPAASVDAVLCRWGYMLVLDPAAALREARRVLRPGGRIALAVWDRREHNPWVAEIADELRALGVEREPAPGEPGMFALDDADRLAETLADAGFVDPLVEPVDLAFSHPSLDDVWESRLDLSPTLGEALRALSPAEHVRLRDAVDARLAPYVGADGTVRLPGRCLCAAADA